MVESITEVNALTEGEFIKMNFKTCLPQLKELVDKRHEMRRESSGNYNLKESKID
jgi:hypothetical protein